MQSWALLVPQLWHKGPQGTASSVVMEDERRNLKSLGDIKDLLDRFKPRLTVKFSIKSLLTPVVVVPLTCPYSLNSITDSAGNQGTVEEAMFYTICLLHSFQVLLPHRFSPPHITGMIYPSYAFQKHTNYLKSRWVKWGTGEQCMVRVSPSKQCETWQQRTIQELSTLYAAYSLTVQPLDFTLLSEPAAVPVSHRETKETFYKLSHIVCVKTDSSDSRQLFIMACVQENVSVSMKRRSFQSSAVHGRCREICQHEQHYLCPNQL